MYEMGDASAAGRRTSGKVCECAGIRAMVEEVLEEEGGCWLADGAEGSEMGAALVWDWMRAEDEDEEEKERVEGGKEELC